MPTPVPQSEQIELTPEQRQTLWEQFVEVYAHSQEAFDTSVRTLAAAGVATTVSLATALKIFDNWGVASVALFLASLGFNLASYATAQLDMRARLTCLQTDDHAGVEGNSWTAATKWANFLAGAALVLGGALLAVFVSAAT